MDINNIKRLFGMTYGLVMLAACDSSETIEAEYVGNYDTPPLIQALDAPLTECPERVWASASQNFKQSEVLVIDRPRGIKNAFHWQAIDKSVNNVELEFLDPQWFLLYNFGYYFGKKTVGLNALEISHHLRSDGSTYWKHDVHLLFHELFHYFAQENWLIDSHERGDVYPLHWQPRYLRTKLIYALQEALSNKSDLSEAKYWYRRYLQEHPEEAVVTNVFDNIEGTAEYAGYVMLALAEYGCNISEEQLIKNINDNIIAFDYTLTSNLESYRLGLLSGLLLRERSNENWQVQVENGVPLVGILLKNIPEKYVSYDTELANKISEDVAYENGLLHMKFSPAINTFKNPEYYRLSLSAESLNFFQMSGAYFINNEANINKITADFEGDLMLGGDVIIEANGIQLIEVKNTPCREGFDINQFIFPIHKDEIKFDELERVAFSNSALTFKDLKIDKVNVDGYQWLCIN
ncbi:hypothetical protein [Catenovulum sediminis]|uniref:Lipoprotein n=1 Tax=Catenovulum sediminis TaxID=1740262 RepID=A0ABV1RCG5_9ALTE|nr:hypothetical protein [Catenovulum sediminis]